LQQHEFQHEEHDQNVEPQPLKI